MKLYYVQSAETIKRWQGTQADAKRLGGKDGFELKEVPTDKPGLLNFLNILEVVDETFKSIRADPVDELEQAELRAVAGDTTVPHYQSPMSAATTIAAIDAGMCASAIRQMDGTNLAKIVSAAIERLAQLTRGPTNGEG